MNTLHKSLLLLIVISFALSGCGTVRLDANTTSFHVVKERVPNLKSGQTIKVDNYYNKPTVVILTGVLDADLYQYTDTAIKLLEQGFSHSNISVGASGKKSIKLKVHNVKYVTGFWSLQVDVNISVELGNGKSFTVYHHNSSPANGYRAISGAITRGVEKVMKHNDFLEYVNS